MLRGAAAWIALFAAFAPACLGQQARPQDGPPNALILVARPGLADPNFARSVVLVTQSEDGSTVGVILNRPLNSKLPSLLRGVPTGNYKDRLYSGGPVMRQSVLAVFRSDSPPAAPAFPVLKGVYLTLHPDNIRRLLADPDAKYRLYAGFAGWAPRQLQSEFQREGWLAARPEEAALFRNSTEALWDEMLQKAQPRMPTTFLFPMESVADLATMPRP